jgi:hypothetical protein
LNKAGKLDALLKNLSKRDADYVQD